MVDSSVNLQETVDYINNMDIFEKMSLLKVFPTKLLVDEVSDRIKRYEAKLESIVDLVNEME